MPIANGVMATLVYCDLLLVRRLYNYLYYTVM